MHVAVPKNPNCPVEDRVFAALGEVREVVQVLVDWPAGGVGWCDVVSAGPKGRFLPAHAARVEDRTAGVAWLVYGAQWGLRLRPSGLAEPWDVDNRRQWGRAFLLLDGNGREIHFRKTSEGETNVP